MQREYDADSSIEISGGQRCQENARLVCLLGNMFNRIDLFLKPRRANESIEMRERMDILYSSMLPLTYISSPQSRVIV